MIRDIIIIRLDGVGMITFEFEKLDSFISPSLKEKYFNRKEEVFASFQRSDMTGWVKGIDSSLISKIKEKAKEVKEYSDCLVVIGIGGSFLASKALNAALSSYFEKDAFPIIYAGTTLSSAYMQGLLSYLDKIDFSVNVISKSGNTLETMVTYQLIKEKMQEKYSLEEMKKRIIITTDAKEGKLYQEVEKEGYFSFPFPTNIGGRYSVMTAAHLFPLAFSWDIDLLNQGYQEGKKYQEQAYTYAVLRRSLFDCGKYVENYSVYEPKLFYFTEWLKQLFAESEGKKQQGILPISTIYTRDLHSLGQFIQEGNKILFETFFQIQNSSFLNYQGNNLHQMNCTISDSVASAHRQGGVPVHTITLDSICEKTMGEVMYFFMMSAAFSAYLFEVDPFHQEGVEIYKQEIKKSVHIQ